MKVKVPIRIDTKEVKQEIKRIKERKLNQVIEKVAEWRRLYTGYVDSEGKNIKLNLEKAARVVGLSKKTLDDYLLQLRAAKKYNFDFNKNKD